MIRILLGLGLLTLPLVGTPFLVQSTSPGQASGIPQLEAMEFTLGQWDFHASFATQGGARGTAVHRSRVERTLDGKAFLDTFCNLAPDGGVDPQGSTVRTFDPATGKWRMLFYGASLTYVTQFEGEFVDGEFHFEGKGQQNGREFLERLTFFDIEEDSYSWNMDRSYDGGETWIESYFAYDAVRVP